MQDRLRLKRLANERWLRRVKRSRLKNEHRTEFSRSGGQPESGYISTAISAFRYPYTPRATRKIDEPRTFKLPKRFSLTTNAEETIRVIASIARYARTCRRPRIVIDHRQIIDLGLGAETLLAVVLKEVSIENQDTPGAYIRGYKATDTRVRRMMDEVGCVRVLDSGVDEDIKVSLRPRAKVFRHQNRAKRLESDALAADPISQTTKEFSDHLDNCLELIGRRLSPRGRARLLSYVAEILINAQEHSGTAHWTIVGFLDQDDTQLVYRCAIFSIGSTISESFRSLDPSSYAWSVVSPYVELHSRKALFGPDWRPDDLLTVVALQGNVSSKLDGPDSDRGQGTVDLIEFFQALCKECTNHDAEPRMSILSGATHVVFDGTYSMEFEPAAGRKIIAFNESNSLLDRPSASAVRVVTGAEFPGVMISIVAPLTEETVEALPPEAVNEN